MIKDVHIIYRNGIACGVQHGAPTPQPGVEETYGWRYQSEVDDCPIIEDMRTREAAEKELLSAKQSDRRKAFELKEQDARNYLVSSIPKTNEVDRDIYPALWREWQTVRVRAVSDNDGEAMDSPEKLARAIIKRANESKEKTLKGEQLIRARIIHCEHTLKKERPKVPECDCSGRQENQSRHWAGAGQEVDTGPDR